MVFDCIVCFFNSLTSDNDQILIDRVFVERKIPDLCPLSYNIWRKEEFCMEGSFLAS